MTASAKGPDGKVLALRRALDAGAGPVEALVASWAADVREIARRERRRLGLPDRVHVQQELEGLAWEVVAEMVALERDGQAPEAYRFDAWVVMRLRNRGRAWVDSEAGVAPASGMSAVLRRGRRILQAMREEQSDARAAIARLNAAARASGSHAGKYSLEDLRALRRAVELDAFTEGQREALTAEEAAEVLVEPEVGWLLAPFEGRAFVEEVVRRVEAVDEGAAGIVRVWLETTRTDEEPPLAAVARAVGVAPSRVRRAVELGRRVGAALAVELGLNP
ncbi:hypothetical protein GZ998_05400 [Actinomyces sp. 594]|uniref:hypothetical protein n=1 Tax=Actinomyces sp. 594 TaxID=2057793 RepID=UPI001C5888B9|nr:hypothetical protein [Actinomyces sp. 594]MBW3068948.1 hypothetical protein [Actinomyces sp. 594]